MIAGVGREFGQNDGGFGAAVQVRSNTKAGFDGGTGEVAVVAHSGEAFGKDVEEPASDEFEDAEGHGAGAFASGGGVVQAELALGGEADDALGSKGAAVDVAGEVAQRGFAAPGGLELDVPLGGWAEGAPLIGGEVLVDLGVVVFECGVNEGAEALGEGVVVD